MQTSNIVSTKSHIMKHHLGHCKNPSHLEVIKVHTTEHFTVSEDYSHTNPQTEGSYLVKCPTIAYLTYLQLSSTAGGCLLYPLHEDMPCCGDWGSTLTYPYTKKKI